MTLNIIIVDDHELFAEALKGIIQLTDIEVESFIYTSGSSALESLQNYKPDLALVDINMPELDGFEFLHQIQTISPLTTVVFISASLDPADMSKAMSLGAAGYIPKTAKPAVILNAIELIIAGGVYVPPEMLGIFQNQQEASPVNKIESVSENNELTQRQMRVLILLSEGLPNKLIARELGCADTTVKAHLAVIFRTLNVKNRTEAVVVAEKKGFLPSR